MLSDEQRRDFREKGWFDVGPVFGPAELGEIRAEYDRLLARPMRIGEKGKTPFEYSPLLHVQSERLCRFATDRRLVEPAVDLLGPDVRLYWDQAVYKYPSFPKEFPWHQDNGYTFLWPELYLSVLIWLPVCRAEELPRRP